jgi:hypothetical protein
MAAHIANRGNATVREFIGELRGLSSTVKQKAVLEEIGASHVSLHSFFGRRKPNGDNIARLLAACRNHSKRCALPSSASSAKSISTASWKPRAEIPRRSDTY